MIMRLLLCAAMAVLLFSCSKDPGVGGKATVKGIIIKEDWNENTGQFTGISYPAPDERIYIDYSADGFLDDDVRTNYDGEFEFRWLRKGDYEIVVYSECPTCDSGQEAIRIPVSIGDRKEEVDVGNVVIQNW